MPLSTLYTHTLTRIYPLAALQQAVLSFTAKSAHNVDTLYFKNIEQKKILKTGYLAKDFDCKRASVETKMNTFRQWRCNLSLVNDSLPGGTATCPSTRSFVSAEHLYVVSFTFHRLKQAWRHRVHSKSVLIFSLCS